MTVLPTLTLPPAPGGSTGPSTSSSRPSRVKHERTEAPDTATDRADRREDRREDGPADFVAELEAALAGAPQTTPPAADGTSDPSSQTLGDGSALVAAIPPALPGSTVNPLFSALPGMAGVSGTEGAIGATPAGTTSPAAIDVSTVGTTLGTTLGTGPLPGAAEGVVPGKAEPTGLASFTVQTADPSTTPLAGATTPDAGQAGTPASASTPIGGQPGSQTGTQTGTQTGQQSNGQSGTTGEDLRSATLAAAADVSQASDPSATMPTLAAGATAPATVTSTTAASSTTTAASVTGQTFPEITRLAQSAGPGTHRIAIVLNPENLGEVKVTMIARAGSLQVHLSADNPTARAALASGTGELHKMLELTAGADTRIVVREAGSSNPSNTDSDGGNRPFASLAEQQGQQQNQARQHASQQGSRPENPYGASPAGSPRTAAPLDGGAPIRPTTTPAGRLDRLM